MLMLHLKKLYLVSGRGFIKHRRLENSPSTMHNSPARFLTMKYGYFLFRQI